MACKAVQLTCLSQIPLSRERRPVGPGLRLSAQAAPPVGLPCSGVHPSAPSLGRAGLLQPFRDNPRRPACIPALPALSPDTPPYPQGPHGRHSAGVLKHLGVSASMSEELPDVDVDVSMRLAWVVGAGRGGERRIWQAGRGKVEAGAWAPDALGHTANSECWPLSSPSLYPGLCL